MARRKALVALATPGWSDLAAIAAFYKNCPLGMCVDHIIPLNHPNVTGLHVLENLQYLTPEENIRKSNSFDGTLENSSWQQLVAEG